MMTDSELVRSAYCVVGRDPLSTGLMEDVISYYRNRPRLGYFRMARKPGTNPFLIG